MFKKLKSKAITLKQELQALYYAYKRDDVRLLPKMIIIISVAYALSPIDLIPDFIPVLGYVDDLIIIPALIRLSIALIPENIMEECRIQAMENPVKLKKNMVSAVVIILIWVIVILFIFHLILE